MVGVIEGWGGGVGWVGVAVEWPVLFVGVPVSFLYFTFTSF
jgi:hypothetical protein